MAKKILTVDDSGVVRKVVRMSLEPLGMTVVEAKNGAEALIAAKREKPDLVILDFNMPVMNGKRALEEMRRDDELREMPVMMLTTEAMKETVVELIQMGLRAYVLKPFSKEEFARTVDDVLRKIDAERLSK